MKYQPKVNKTRNYSDRQSLEEAANEWKNDRYHYVGGSCFGTWDIKAAFKAGAEWAKKNKY